MVRKLLRRRVVEDRSGLARSSIYEKMEEGEFPRPVKLGSRAVAWIEDEVNEWIEARIAEREAAEALKRKRAEEAERRANDANEKRPRRRATKRVAPNAASDDAQ
jgi:prophage regulatory protein